MPENEIMEKHGKNIKPVDVNSLRKGMFVEDVYTSEGILLFSEGKKIESEEQIRYIKNHGVSKVFLNIEQSDDSAVEQYIVNRSRINKKIKDIEREENYYRELEKATEVHRETVSAVRSTLGSIRRGGTFSAKKIKDNAEDIVESVLRNSDALSSLCQIKGYDEYTFTHSVNVGILATSLACSMGYGKDQLLNIGMGGLLHDIGKMLVVESILNKPGKLTDREFEIVKRHPADGLNIVRRKREIPEEAEMVVILHHERYNGRGYPRGLKRDQISEIGTISAVADVYDALTSDRVYKKAWTPQKALAVIFKGCDTDYKKNVVELFTKHLGVYPVGSFVKLSSGEMGIVTKVDRGNLLNPSVTILFDSNGEKISTPMERRLSQENNEQNGKNIIMSLDPLKYNVKVSSFFSKDVYLHSEKNDKNKRLKEII